MITVVEVLEIAGDLDMVVILPHILRYIENRDVGVTGRLNYVFVCIEGMPRCVAKMTTKLLMR